MYLAIFSVLAVIGILLSNLFKKPKNEVSEADLEDFNSGPPTMYQILEAESKGMIASNLPHNQGPPIFNLQEMQKIIKTMTKRLKKHENDLNEFQKSRLQDRINTEKMF